MKPKHKDWSCPRIDRACLPTWDYDRFIFSLHNHIWTPQPQRGAWPSVTFPNRSALWAMGASACSRARVESVKSEDRKDVEIKDGQGDVLRCISLETKRPDFLADAIPSATRSLQGSDPTHWATTNVKLLELFNCMQSTQEYRATKEAWGNVCLYDVNSLFVIPWSRGFGCGVARLMNAHAPLKAQVMVSHAWAEDVEGLGSSLSSWASRIQPLWDCDGVPLWCCTFAQYQPEDGAEPSLQDQLSLDPFKSVICGVCMKLTKLWNPSCLSPRSAPTLWVTEWFALAGRSADTRPIRHGSERSSKAKMGAMSVWTGPSRLLETHCRRVAPQ